MKTVRTRFIEIVSYFFILLFCYASISKMMDFENFQYQIGQSPLLTSYSDIISYGILALELSVSMLLIFEKTRRLGLYASFVLMVSFSFYIYLILNYSEFIPCSCGGILEKMDWRTHLIFNIITVFLAAAAILVQTKILKENLTSAAILMFLLSLCSVGILIFLHQQSVNLTEKENNFVRRFLQHPVDEERRFDLKVNSYYFAGSTKDSMYLGNHTTPFILSSIDNDFQKIKALSVVPDQSDFTFKSSKMLVKNNHYYLYDGTIPILYKGNTGQTHLKTISYKQIYFSQLQTLNEESFPIITYSLEKKIQSLGLLSLNPKVNSKVHPELLEKVNDGIFDTDGKLAVDHYSDKIIYSYSYKNKFVVLDSNLKNKQTFHTIDDLSNQQIEVVHLKDGQKKMKNHPVIVNKSVFAYKGLLFIESDRMGKFENKKQQKQSITIDIYATNEKKYLGSFYLPNPKSSKKTQFHIKDDRLYLIIENELISYRFAQNIVKHFRAGEAENLNTE